MRPGVRRFRRPANPGETGEREHIDQVNADGDVPDADAELAEEPDQADETKPADEAVEVAEVAAADSIDNGDADAGDADASEADAPAAEKPPKIARHRIARMSWAGSVTRATRSVGQRGRSAGRTARARTRQAVGSVPRVAATGREFARLTVLPAALVVAWLLPAIPLLLGGAFSLAPMLVISIPLAAAIIVIGLRRTPGRWPMSAQVNPGRGEGRAPWWTLLGTVAVAAGFAVWQIVMNSEQIIVTRDQGIYLQFGYWIAQHGSASVPASAAAFGGNHSGLLFSSLGFIQHGTTLAPQFLAGLPAVLAAGAWAGGAHGVHAALLVPPVLGALAVLTFGGLVGRLAGPRWAPAGALVLAFALPQQYTSRSSFSETLVQILLFGGLCLTIDSLCSPVGRTGRAGSPAAGLAGAPAQGAAGPAEAAEFPSAAAEGAVADSLTESLPGSWTESQPDYLAGTGTDASGETRADSPAEVGTDAAAGSQGDPPTTTMPRLTRWQLTRWRQVSQGRLRRAGPSRGRRRQWAGPSQATVLAALGGLALGLTAAVRVDGLSDLLPAIPFIGILFAARKPQWLPFGAGLLVGVGYGLADGYLLARPYMDSLGSSMRTVGIVAGGLAIVTLDLALFSRLDVLRRLVKRVLAVPPLRWLPGTVALLTGLVVIGFAVRPYVQTVRGDSNASVVAYVGYLQRLAGLPLDPRRLYSEDTLYWVIWYIGVPAVLLGAFGIALLGRRVTRALVTWRDPTGSVRIWGLPLLIIGWVTVSVLWRPAIVPDQPWASRRLVPVILPGLILAAVWAAAWLTTQAAQRGAGRLASSAVVTLCVGALLLPTALTTFGVGVASSGPPKSASSGGLALHRAARGEEYAVGQLCAAIGPGASVVIVNPRIADEFAQLVRGICDTPTGVMNRPSPFAVQEVIAGILRARRHPVLLGANQAELASYGAIPRQVLSLGTTQDAHVLTRPPTSNWPVRYVLWMAQPS